jgi:hypothetical protein
VGSRPPFNRLVKKRFVYGCHTRDRSNPILAAKQWLGPRPALAAAAELRRLEARRERARQRLHRALGHRTKRTDRTVFKQGDYVSRLVAEHRELTLKILQLELLA